MIDPRFYATPEPLTLAQIAAATGAKLVQGDPAQLFGGVAPLAVATPADVSFLTAARRLGDLAASAAGACFVTAELVDMVQRPCALLVVADPQAAFVTLARLMHPDVTATGVIDPRAVVAADAVIGAGVDIAAGAVIGARVQIGDGCRIGANTVIATGVEIGAGSVIGPNVTISHALIGARVVIHAGAVIGGAGFGYIPGPAGLIHIPQLGRAILEDEVEVGANTTIDRGAGEDTVIGRGTKIDNLVQIGHNCRIGRFCIIVSQVGISGSATVGDGVILGGQVGVADHVTIGSGARLAAKSGVSGSLAAGRTYGGMPAQEIGLWRREVVTLRNLARADKTKTRP